MSRPLRILIGGGARSGKSAFALDRAGALGPRRVFIATAEARDDEMRERISRHRRERSDAFVTIEEPRAVPSAIARLAGSGTPDVVLVDCLTIWLANLLGDGEDPLAIARCVDSLLEVLAEPPCHVVLVSNEVGMGIVPENRLARDFRDLTGMVHQRLVATCDEIYLATLGFCLRVRPGPVELVSR